MAVTVNSCHCKAMEYRIGDDSGPGRNERRTGEPILVWPGSTSSALSLVPTPPANGGHPIPEGGRPDVFLKCQLNTGAHTGRRGQTRTQEFRMESGTTSKLASRADGP